MVLLQVLERACIYTSRGLLVNLVHEHRRRQSKPEETEHAAALYNRNDRQRVAAGSGGITFGDSKAKRRRRLPPQWKCRSGRLQGRRFSWGSGRSHDNKRNGGGGVFVGRRGGGARAHRLSLCSPHTPTATSMGRTNTFAPVRGPSVTYAHSIRAFQKNVENEILSREMYC